MKISKSAKKILHKKKLFGKKKTVYFLDVPLLLKNKINSVLTQQKL